MLIKSKYIHECNIEDKKIILIHTLTFVYFIIKDSDYNNWISENFQEMDQDNVAQLIDMKFLIKNYDEDVKILKLAQEYFSTPQLMIPNIVIYITNECNLRCSYCFTGYEHNKEYETISLVDVDKIFDAIIYIYSNNKFLNGGPIISLFGGEPLLVKNKYIIEYIFKRLSNISINSLEIVSNIVNIKYFADVIKEYKKTVYVRVTLNGEKDVHDNLRKSNNDMGTYEISIKNMKYMLEKVDNIVFELLILLDINGANLNGIEKMFNDLENNNLLNNKRVDIKFGKIQFRGDYVCLNYKNQVLDVEDYYPKLLEFKRKIPYIKENMLSGSSMYKFIEMYKFWKYNTMITPSFKGCDAVYPGRFCFFTDGYIYPCFDCVGMNNFRIGEYRNKLKFNDNFLAWNSFNTKNIIKCNNCKYVGFCNGGCLITNQSKNNDIYDVHCENVEQSLNKFIIELDKEEFFDERNMH